MKIYILLLFVAVCSLHAERMIKYHFEGTIDDISSNTGNILGSITTGERINGYIAFDLDGEIGSDRFPGKFYIKIGDIETTLTSDFFFVRAKNNDDHDRYGIVDSFRHGFDPGSYSSLAGPLKPSLTIVEFIDSSHAVFSNTDNLEFPIEISLDDFDITKWVFWGTDLASETNDFHVSGTIDTVSIEYPPIVIPELVLSVSHSEDESGAWTWRRVEIQNTIEDYYYDLYASEEPDFSVNKFGLGRKSGNGGKIEWFFGSNLRIEREFFYVEVTEK